LTCVYTSKYYDLSSMFRV